jgi:hypothetical protein
MRHSKLRNSDPDPNFFDNAGSGSATLQISKFFLSENVKMQNNLTKATIEKNPILN